MRSFSTKIKTSSMARNLMTAPPIFSGENYQIWSVKMKSYLEANDLWDVVMFEIQPLQEDPTVAQIINYNDESIRRLKAKICIHSVAVFTLLFLMLYSLELWLVKQLKKHGTLSKRHFKGMKELDRCKFPISEENLRC